MEKSGEEDGRGRERGKGGRGGGGVMGFHFLFFTG